VTAGGEPIRSASYASVSGAHGATAGLEQPLVRLVAAVVDVEQLGARVKALAEVVAKLLERVGVLERESRPDATPREA
jgi:hypothetical protein